jgi:hypothetical protein
MMSLYHRKTTGLRASKSFDQNKVTVFTSTGETAVFDNTNIGDVELSIPQANFLKVKLTNIDLELDIISIENGLVATMTYPMGIYRCFLSRMSK